MSFESSDDLVRLGNAAVDRGDHVNAIHLFALAVDHGAVWAGLNLGNSYEAIGDLGRAEEAFAGAWAAGEDDAGFNLALLIQGRGRVDDARSVFRKLIQSGYTKAMDQEAWYLREEGNLSESVQLMSRAASTVGPDADRAAGILGTWLWDADHDTSVEPLLRRAVESYAPARVAIAELFVEGGHVAEAEVLLRRGVEAGEDESLIPLSNLVHERGDLAEAEVLLRAGSDAGDSHAPYNLALLLLAAERSEEAMGFLRLASSRGNDRATKKLRKIQ